MQSLGEQLTDEDIEEMMNEADSDGDGNISFAGRSTNDMITYFLCMGVKQHFVIAGNK